MKNLILFRSLFILSFLSLSCSLFQNRSDQGTGASGGIKKQDVPFAARNSGEAGPVLRHRIVVLPFLDPSEDRAGHVVTSARSAFVDAMVESERVVLVSPSDLEVNLDTFIKNGEYQMDGILKMAKQIGAEAVVEGKLLDVRIRREGDSVGVFRKLKSTIVSQARLRAFSTRSGKEIYQKVHEFESDEKGIRVLKPTYKDRSYEEDPYLIQAVINQSFIQGGFEILEKLSKLSWQGRVALVNGDRVYLNVGRLSGLEVGDLLKVSDKGEEVFDPETGMSIGAIPGKLKGTLEIISYFGQDGSIAVVHSGAGFKENDQVELY